MRDWQEQENAFAKAAAGIDVERWYSRTEACACMGISNAAFARDFKDNALYLAYGEPPKREGPRGTYYRGSELIAQIGRLENPLNGCLLYIEYVYETDEQFKKDHRGRSKAEVFKPGAYLSIIGYVE